jgi:hypothetical protein
VEKFGNNSNEKYKNHKSRLDKLHPKLNECDSGLLFQSLFRKTLLGYCPPQETSFTYLQELLLDGTKKGFALHLLDDCISWLQ